MKNLKIKIMQECFRSGNEFNLDLANKWLDWILPKVELVEDAEPSTGVEDSPAKMTWEQLPTTPIKDPKLHRIIEDLVWGKPLNEDLLTEWLLEKQEENLLKDKLTEERGVVILEADVPKEWLEFAKKLGMEVMTPEEWAEQTKDKFKEVKEAFARGEKIEYCFEDRWYEASAPSWDPKLEYRVKPKL